MFLSETSSSELSTAIGNSTQRVIRDVRRCTKDTMRRDLYPSYGETATCGKETKSSRLCLHPQSHGTCERGVALAGKFFGEDSERLVREFREIGPGTGRHVARSKESRFQIDIATTDQQQIYAFHETFCNTQEKRLEKVPGYDAERRPKMSFRYKTRR